MAELISYLSIVRICGRPTFLLLLSPAHAGLFFRRSTPCVENRRQTQDGTMSRHREPSPASRICFAREERREVLCECFVNPKADELLLGTDAVDVVVKATVARAGQIAAATENSIAEPAPSTAETSAGSSLFDVRKSRNTMPKAGPLNRKITANKSFGARRKRAAAKCTAIRSRRRRGRARLAARRGREPWP
jgi:hypothetical protein